jgi:NDP-sugar pyrophosphorylase family protein
MRAGVIAAGVGSRLHSEGRRIPKALKTVAGVTLIDRTLTQLAEAGATDAVIIVNELSTSVRDHAAGASPIPTRWIVETTPSSMHSFLRVLEDLAGDGDRGPFLMSTVDTVVPSGTFRDFAARAGDDVRSDVVLALTSFVDDENPLRVTIAQGVPEPATVTAIGQGPLVTAGYYLVRSSVLQEADRCRARQISALRSFFHHLFDRGYRLAGMRMADSVDVDRPADIQAAEQLLRSSDS